MYHDLKRNRRRFRVLSVDQINAVEQKEDIEERKEQRKQQEQIREEEKRQKQTEKIEEKIQKQQKKIKKEEEKKQRLQAKLRKREEKRKRQEERWRRWGHTRKPNFLVLALYAVFDWFADFGPMLRALKQRAGKGARHSWRFIVDGIIYLLNISQIIGIIYVSIGHSYSLLIYGGAMGTAAFVMVYIFESVFVFCSVLIDISIKRGIRNPWAWAGFLIGFIFVEASNVFAMGRNFVGTSVGVVLPILLIVMKKVMEWWYRKPKKKEKKFSWCFWRKNGTSEHGTKNGTDVSGTKNGTNVSGTKNGTNVSGTKNGTNVSGTKNGTDKNGTKKKMKEKEKEKEKERVKKWGVEYTKETGKPPGRKLIQQNTNCSQRLAREVAQELKKEFGFV